MTIATALDAPDDRLDDQEKAFVNQIREHGWFRTNVFSDDDGPGFSYTTGFWLAHGVPEIIVFSLKSEIAHAVLWDLYRESAEGTVFPAGQRLSNVFANTDAVFLPVAKSFYPDHLGWSRWFYGNDDWPCMQLIWPDAQGKFPWQSGYEERFAISQPNLTGQDWPAI